MSGERGIIRKVFDIPPTAITSNGNFDGSGSPTTAWAAGIQPGQWLSGISESVADNGRVGLSVAVESFDIRVKVTPQHSLTGHGHLRMIIVADLENDGVLPTLQEILGDANGSATAITSGLELSFLQPGYFGRFQVIEDKNWYWFSVANATIPTYAEHKVNDSVGFLHESHHDMKGHRIQWDTTDLSAQANARKGHIYMYFLYSQTTVTTGGIPVVVTTNPPAIQFTSRLRYRDA